MEKLIAIALALAGCTAPSLQADAGAPGHSLRHPVEMHLREAHDDRAHVTCWTNVDELSGTYSAPFCLRDVYADQPQTDPLVGPAPGKGKL